MTNTATADHADLDARFERHIEAALARAGAQALRREVPGEGAMTIDFGFTAAGLKWCVELYRLTVSGRSDKSLNCVAKNKIANKLFKDGRPKKFPQPADAIHVLLVDTTALHRGGPDMLDIREMLYGADAVSDAVRTTDGPGLFEDAGQPVGRALRARVHALGFVSAHSPADVRTALYANPGLLQGVEAERILSAWPL